MQWRLASTFICHRSKSLDSMQLPGYDPKQNHCIMRFRICFDVRCDFTKIGGRLHRLRSTNIRSARGTGSYTACFSRRRTSSRCPLSGSQTASGPFHPHRALEYRGPYGSIRHHLGEILKVLVYVTPKGRSPLEIPRLRRYPLALCQGR